MTRDVLLLNASEEVLSIIDWKKAIRLIQSGKARAPHNYKEKYSVRTVKGDYTLPAAIVLVQYVHIPWDNDPQPTRKNVFRRDNWTCQYCGFRSKNPKTLTIDHVHPRSRGGDSSWTNLITSCESCNHSKSNKSLKESKMKLNYKPYKPSFCTLRLVGLDKHGKQIWRRWLTINMKNPI
jgi:5-methylcytosine-specific restriction endonuclease McrA